MVKHLFAYDSDNNIININDAIKGNKYFLFPDKQVEIIVKAGEINRKHYALLSESSITFNGLTIPFSRINESPEHFNMKMKIAKDLKFYYKSHTILLKSAKIEYTINESMYRADIMGELFCGTNCIIEIIKTSDLSKEKRDYINKNNILTFKLYLNKNGNIDTSGIDVIGCREIDEIRNRIELTRNNISIQKERESRITETIFELTRKSLPKETNSDKQHRENVEIIESIRELKTSMGDIEKGVFRETSKSFYNKAIITIKEIRGTEQKVFDTEREIEQRTKAYRYFKKRVDTIRDEQGTIDSEFTKIAESCKIEWFRPDWVKYRTSNIINEIKYWTR
jgi:hypothetical protein